MSFFHDLYCGQQCPAEQTPDTDEFRTASKTLARVSQELLEALSHEQRILLDGYKNAMEECAELIYAEAFRQGFLLGAEFIKEIPEAYRPLRK